MSINTQWSITTLPISTSIIYIIPSTFSNLSFYRSRYTSWCICKRSTWS